VSGTVSRPVEEQAVGDFLDAALRQPSALLVEGEPGIGKTTLCLYGVEQARRRRMRVLSTRPAEAESVAAYSALADLLGGIEAGVLERLPKPQLMAVDHVLLRADDTDAFTEPRAVAATFLAIVRALAEQGPVLIVVDDVQWLDPSSVFALGFAVRRFTERIGVLASRRTGSGAQGASWLQVGAPEALRRITLAPFSIGELSELLSTRLGRQFTRSAVRRIHEISGGNPFYALELGRGNHGGTAEREVALPETLSELVDARIRGLAPDTWRALLAAACLATPSTDVIARAMGTSTRHVAALLEPAEDDDVVRIDGIGVRFSHPLLAHGVYAGVSPADRPRDAPRHRGRRGPAGAARPAPRSRGHQRRRNDVVGSRRGRAHGAQPRCARRGSRIAGPRNEPGRRRSGSSNPFGNIPFRKWRSGAGAVAAGCRDQAARTGAPARSRRESARGDRDVRRRIRFGGNPSRAIFAGGR
jgi:hypothetical protein